MFSWWFDVKSEKKKRGECLRFSKHRPLFFLSQYSTVMTLIFNGWSAYNIMGSLNKKEVCAILLDYDIKRSCFRTWDTIEDMILASSDEVKSVVYESALVKRKVEEEHRVEVLKCKHEEKQMVRNVHWWLGEFLLFSWYCAVINIKIVSGKNERDFTSLNLF